MKDMCLTVPRQVKMVKGEKALMQDGRWVSTKLVGGVKKGDMLMVQADVAVEKVSAEQSKQMKQVMETDSEINSE